MNVPSRTILRYGAPTLIACFGTPSGAPTSEVSPLETAQATGTRREAIRLDVAAGVTTVNVQKLALHLPLTVVDHFRGEPGTYIKQTTLGQGTVIIRGLKGSEILNLVEGFRTNNAIFRNAGRSLVVYQYKQSFCDNSTRVMLGIVTVWGLWVLRVAGLGDPGVLELELTRFRGHFMVWVGFPRFSWHFRSFPVRSTV